MPGGDPVLDEEGSRAESLDGGSSTVDDLRFNIDEVLPVSLEGLFLFVGVSL